MYSLFYFHYTTQLHQIENLLCDVGLAVEASSTTETKEGDSTEKVEESIDENEQAIEDFSCEICGFRGNWENKLVIHMMKTQLDGVNSISEDSE